MVWMELVSQSGFINSEVVSPSLPFISMQEATSKNFCLIDKIFSGQWMNIINQNYLGDKIFQSFSGMVAITQARKFFVNL